MLLTRVTRGLDGVADATNPLVDLLRLLLHGVHAATARPPYVVAQDVLLGMGAVIGLDKLTKLIKKPAKTIRLNKSGQRDVCSSVCVGV